MVRRELPLRLVVIGGGFTGAVVAMNAIRATRRPLAITVIEPSAVVGRGIAYGTNDPAHRTNVPTDRMNLFRDEPAQATGWLSEQGFLDDPACRDAHGQFYVSRAFYGAFIVDALNATLNNAGERVSVEHWRTAATRLTEAENGWSVATDGGASVDADVIALCFGHAVPALPCPVAPDVQNHPQFVPNPWADTFDAIGPADSVLIVGTGLTMADVVVSLGAKGHRGSITAVSRRGLLPRSHGLFRSDYDLFDGTPVPTTALGLLRLVRRRIREDGRGAGWQPIIDALRFELPAVWGGLPASEKRKVLPRLLAFWDVHRFRIAPQVDTALRQARESGRLTVERAGLVRIGRVDGRFTVRLKKAGADLGERSFDAVVLCTGPEKDIGRKPLIAGLLESGAARLDDVRLGLAVDAESRVLDRTGKPWPNLFAFGPMTRGSFGEMTGAPDIAAHVERIADRLFVQADPDREPLS